jgi:hypothetical protein
MVRQLNTEVESGQLGGGGSRVSLAQGAPADISTINQGVIPAGGEAEMAYNQQLAQIGNQILSKRQDGLDRLAASDSLCAINAQMLTAGEQYLKGNPSGGGYQSFMTNKYKELSEEAIGDAPNREVATMLQLHAKVGLADTFQSSLMTEKKITTEYKVTRTEENSQVIFNNLYMNPFEVSARKLELLSTIEAIKEAAPTEYEEYKRKKLNEFASVYASGLIKKDPYEALKLLEKEKIEDLRANDRNTLIHHAKNDIYRQEVRAERVKKAQEKISNERHAINNVKIEDAIAAEQITTEWEIHSADLSPLQKEKNIKLLHDHQRQEKKNNEVESKILYNVSNNLPTTEFPEEKINKAYRNIVRQKEESEVPMTLMDKVRLGVSLRTDKSIHDLVTDLTKAMDDGYPQEVINASMAIRYCLDQNPKIIDKLDKKYTYMSSYVAGNVIFSGSEIKNADKVIARGRDILLKNQNHAEMKNNKEFFTKYMQDQSALTNLQNIAGRIVGENSQYLRAATIDAKRILEEVYMSGFRGSDALAMTNDQLRRIYQPTFLNFSEEHDSWGYRWGLISSFNSMKYSPEFMYPEYQGTHFLKNTLFHNTQYIVSENIKSLGEHSDVKLIEPLIKKPKTRDELFNSNLTTMDFPQIYGKVNGKWEKRNVFIECEEYDQPGTYRLYWLYDEDNHLTKRWLKLSNEVFATPINFKK